MLKRFFLLACAAYGVLALSPVAYSQNPGDVYFWEFNEGSGLTVKDDMGLFTASLGIIVTDADLPGNSDDSPSGKAGDKSLIPGKGLTVDDSVDPILNIQAGPITMEAWIKVEALNQYNGIAAYGASYKMGINNGTIVWTFYGIEDVDSGVAMEADNVWHHVAAAWEPGVGVSFYVDGELAGYKETTNTSRALQNNRLDIGSETNGAVPLQGLVDRLRVHNAVLDETQIDSDVANPKAPLEKTLVSYNFDEGGEPHQNAAPTIRPAVSTAAFGSKDAIPAFSTDTPTGKAGDFSLNFDGTDQVIYPDEGDIMSFWDEDFTFEAWVKFDAVKQKSDRVVLLAYGIGGQSGYSFSFRPRLAAQSLADSPSGKAGDLSVKYPVTGDDSTGQILAIQSGPITMEAWVKIENFGTYDDIVRYGSSYKMGFHNGNLLFTLLGIVDVESTYKLAADQTWHHIAMAWEPGAGVSFYVDGELKEYIENTGAARDLQNNTLSVGSSDTGSSPLYGAIDRARIHNAVLKVSELDSAAANPKAPLAKTIVSYDFDGGMPYQNGAGSALPLNAMYKGSLMTVTTYGILDAHSNAVIPNDVKWHHIAAVHQQGVEFRYYVDGQLADRMEYTGGVRLADVLNFYIGCESGGGLPYTGLLDRLKITRGAVPQDQLDYFAPVAVNEWSLF